MEINKHSKKIKKEDVDFVAITKQRFEEYLPSISKENEKYLLDKNLIKHFRKEKYK